MPGIHPPDYIPVVILPVKLLASCIKPEGSFSSRSLEDALLNTWGVNGGDQWGQSSVRSNFL